MMRFVALYAVVLSWAGAVCLAPNRVSAAESGDAVVVLYNKAMPESKAVAEHYAQARHVPKPQVVGFKLPITETMSRAEFRDQLQEPLFEYLLDKKLMRRHTGRKPAGTNENYRPIAEAKIRYLVLCYGVPLKITRDDKLVEMSADKVRPELRRNEAAVDAELAWLPVMKENITLSGPMVNPFFMVTNASLMHPTNGLLMVSRLDGPTPEIAKGLVDKALTAETYGLWGRAYVDSRGITNGAYKTGDDMMRGTASAVRRLGFETVLDRAPETFPAGFPLSQIAIYAGWYDGQVSGPFTLPMVEFMPGAFAYHLHSYSAATLRSATSHWTGPLLAKGATITLGTVEEPFLSGTPEIGVLLERLIYFRFSFGEAAYAGQSTLSWQTTVVGDPLYRPFAQPPDVLHHNLERRMSRLVEWSHLRVVNLNLAMGILPQEMIEYLVQVPFTEQSAVLQEKLGDLLLADNKVADALQAYERATRLQPSSQQKIRLMLQLAEIHLKSGKTREAYSLYQKLLDENPDYAGARALYQKLVPMAQKLGFTGDVERFQAALQKASAPPPSPPATLPGK